MTLAERLDGIAKCSVREELEKKNKELEKFARELQLEREQWER